MTTPEKSPPRLAGTAGATITENDKRLLVTEREAARMLRICDRSLWQLARDGAVPVERLGGSKRYSIIALDCWVRLGCPPGPDGADRVRAALRAGGVA